MLNIISFTKNGYLLGERICRLTESEIESSHTTMYRKQSGCSLGEWTRNHFKKGEVLLFIGACGIAVRSIAPYMKSKDTDPAVLVMDEKGGFCIPILSGHLGGANDAAELLAELTGAKAVLTTATDVNHKFAVDVFAGKNDFVIEDLRTAKQISSEILDGKTVELYVGEGAVLERETEQKLPPELHCNQAGTDIVISDTYLHLYPKSLILGIGCKTGKTMEELERFVLRQLDENKLALQSVFCVASIDKKANEAGLLALCEKYGWEFQTFTAPILMEQEGAFSVSDFVRQTVGVDNVCERSVMAAGAEELVLEKTCHDGMTLAVGRRKRRISF